MIYMNAELFQKQNQKISYNNLMKTWSELFEELPWYKEDKNDDYNMEVILKANCHLTSQMGGYNIQKWNKTVQNIKTNLNYVDDISQQILEVGCGAGALLKYFENDKNILHGIDPSHRYHEIIKKTIPNGEFLIGDALDISTYPNDSFDIILCYSTCQYFTNIAYMNKFVNLCYQKLKIGGKLLLGDLLKKELEDEYIQYRINCIGIDEYTEKYKNLSHLYISNSDLDNMLNEFIVTNKNDSTKRGNETQSYRIDVYCEKVNTRSKSILTNEHTLEELYTISKFPVSLSCVSHSPSNDKYMDMIFQICQYTGIIQIKHAPSLDDIYISPHNTSYGSIWNNLFDTFKSIINTYIQKNANIIEIGGGSLLLASKLLENQLIQRYIVYEKNISKNHLCNNDPRVNVINDYFTDTSVFESNIHFCIHSHVLEHVWNPVEFIRLIGKELAEDSYHCFIVPNLKETFSKKYTNALDFEHNFFIREEYIDVILNNNQFDILEKQYYLDHSIIYITKKSNANYRIQKYPNLYTVNKFLALEFKQYHLDLITQLNHTIQSFQGKLYLFGGTGFSIYLIKFGLVTDKIIYILDNDPTKKNKRVYGTNLIVKQPNIIQNDNNVGVIVKAASYQNEIENQLYEINPQVHIFK